MKYEKCKVVMLPTDDKKAPILAYKGKEKPQYFTNQYWSNTNLLKCHLYILAEEKLDGMYNKGIQAGDFVYVNGAIVVAELDNGTIGFKTDVAFLYFRKGHRKVIASTDTKLDRQIAPCKLVPNGLIVKFPRPSTEFIKAYCAKGGIDEVLVEYEYGSKEEHRENFLKNKSKLNSYMEAATYKLNVAPDNTITIKRIKESWNKEEIEMLIAKAIKDHCYLSTSNQPYNDDEEKELVEK